MSKESVQSTLPTWASLDEFLASAQLKPPFLILAFDRSSSPLLLEARFAHKPGSAVIVTRLSSTAENGFNWTKGVKAMAIFFLRVAASRSNSKDPVGVGLRPSWVSCFADLVRSHTSPTSQLAKGNAWAMRMFRSTHGTWGLADLLFTPATADDDFTSVSINPSRFPPASVRILLRCKTPVGRTVVPYHRIPFVEIKDESDLAELASVIDATTTWGRAARSPTPDPNVSSPAPHTRLVESVQTILAILPFKLPHGSDLDVFTASGLCDDLVGRIGRLSCLRVISHETIGSLSSSTTALDTGRKLGATAVLAGKISQSHSHFRVNIQLIEVDSGFTLWTDSVEYSRHSLPSVVRGIVLGVAAALKVDVPIEHRAKLTAGATTDGSAYEFYIRAAGLLNTNSETDLRSGLRAVDEALSIDPDYADAHALKGFALWKLYFSGWDADARHLQTAIASVDRALKLDPSSASARLSRVRILWDLGKHRDGLKEGVAAFDNNPRSIPGVLALARSCNNAGLATLAIHCTRHVLIFEPTNITAQKLRIWNLLMTEAYGATYHEGLEYLRRNPEDANTAWAIGMACVHLNRHAEAIRIVRAAVTIDPANAPAWLLLGTCHQSSGEAALAVEAWSAGIRHVSERLVGHRSNYRSRAWLACLLAAVGYADKAVGESEAIEAENLDNSYILYRLASVYSILGLRGKAIRLLRVSRRAGWLSDELMVCEERLGLANIADMADYSRLKRQLRESALRVGRELGVELRVNQIILSNESVVV